MNSVTSVVIYDIRIGGLAVICQWINRNVHRANFQNTFIYQENAVTVRLNHHPVTGEWENL